MFIDTTHFFVELFTDVSAAIPIIGSYFILKEKKKTNIVLLNKLLLCMLIDDFRSIITSMVMTYMFSFEGIKGYGYVVFQIMLGFESISWTHFSRDG
ncbi:hypothetical protein AOY35_13305 [Enterococcus faecium]|nr:hypothetical protein AOY35_13305 [Enterococcus faecium]